MASHMFATQTKQLEALAKAIHTHTMACVRKSADCGEP